MSTWETITAVTALEAVLIDCVERRWKCLPSGKVRNPVSIRGWILFALSSVFYFIADKVK